ncbi:hypothetical protein GCM10023219_03570 [Stakelama sediminis]|uniref:Capsule biosynthesis protein n=1 Tax=Stakelama sediminis TaxID=463200 RepID=A0A840YZD9_9SPHN|nr:DUF6356 family protein [Stakelama sediminis]MBB5719013.1 hypothetical protein [Stakelama sediminis]
MLHRLFLDHPQSVGESYGEHFGVASRFGARLVVGGLACMVHAVLPFAFKTSGSDTVKGLHEKLVRPRDVVRDARIQQTVIDYVI